MPSGKNVATTKLSRRVMPTATTGGNLASANQFVKLKKAIGGNYEKRRQKLNH
jgi:hypothetical protein